MTQQETIVSLRSRGRIWVVGAIHGDASRLYALHDQIADHVQHGDRLIYLGNMIGVGVNIIATLNELLTFRRWFLSIPPFVDANDVIYLRGAQEEMWQKLLQLQLAQDPLGTFKWMMERGIEATINAYGFDPDEGISCAREGAMALTQWTGNLMNEIHNHPGHDELMIALKHAAHTKDGSCLFVHTGIDRQKPLEKQSDSFWWAGRSFALTDGPYEGFNKLIRGYDPDHKGFQETSHSLTVDGGCGFGGPLAAACIDSEGNLLNVVKV